MDTAKRTVTKVWEFKDNPLSFAVIMGAATRLGNGNTIINWNDSIREVKPDGTAVSFLSINSSGLYRAFKTQIKLNVFVNNVNTIGNYSFSNDTNSTNISIELDTLNGQGNLTVEKHYYPAFDASFTSVPPCLLLPYRWVITKSGINYISGKIKIELNNLPEISDPKLLKLYKRDKDGFGTFTELQNIFYDSGTNTLEADFNGFGEFIIGTDITQNPILIAPANNSWNNTTNGSLSWEIVSGSTSYNIQLDSSIKFSNPIFDKSISDTTNIQYSNLKNNQEYWWRVMYSSPCGTSNWSDTFRFITKLSTATNISPLDNSTSQAISGIIKWDPVPSATYYRFQLSIDEQFNSIMIDTNYLVSNSFNYLKLNNNRTYYWRVIAFNDSNSSDWSSIYSFTTILGTPIQIYPANNAAYFKQNDSLVWKPVSGAELYELQVSKTVDFDSLVFDMSNILKTSYSMPILNYNRKYFWRVQASNIIGKSAWSSVQNLLLKSKART